MSAETRLATYGSLGPGKLNNRELAVLTGTWTRGTVHGRFFDRGWGAALGYPGLVLDADGDAIDVDIFGSADLPEHWARLDAFEGDGYRRAVTRVATSDGDVDACLYVLAEVPTFAGEGGPSKNARLEILAQVHPEVAVVVTGHPAHDAAEGAGR